MIAITKNDEVVLKQMEIYDKEYSEGITIIIMHLQV